jgi:hypothetical protein
MRFGRILGTLNGTLIGSIIGLAILNQYTGSFSISIVIAAFGGAFAASLFTGFKMIPGSFGGLAGGLVGIGIAVFPVPLLAVPVPGVSTYAIGGIAGGIVVLFLPPLR